MVAGLLGLGDKRHIVYTLIRVLGGLGRTIFLTPNKQYLMLSQDHLLDFEINDVQVVVYECDIEDLHEEYGLSTYEYVIYDILKDFPADLDVALMLDSREHYMYDMEDRELDMIPLFTAVPVKKDDMFTNEKIVKVPPASLVEPQLQKMFTDRVLLPIKGGPFFSAMLPLVINMTGLTSSQISPRMKKKELKV